MEYLYATPWTDLLVLLVLMFLFARHEGDWEPTTARSGVHFYYLNPKAIIIFWPQFVLCRILISFDLLHGALALLLFFLPLAPLLYRFFYVPWRKAFLIAGCFLAYMTVTTVLIHQERVAEETTSPIDLEEVLGRSRDRPAPSP